MRRSGAELVIAILGGVCLLVVGGVWLYATFAFGLPEGEGELRQRLATAGAFPLIREIADQVISERSTELIADRTISSRPAGAKALSRLRELGINSVWPIRDEGGEVVGVAFMLGGADMHYGVFVAAAEGAVPRVKEWHFKSWDDDFWFISEIPF